jgi:hypothetical protein
MPSVTLAESAKLANDELVAGVIANVITVNQMYELLPFDDIEGNSLAYNRENVLGDVQTATVGDTITAKAAATFTKVNSNLTTIIGDAEVNGLVQATRSGDTDQEATQIASKAKSAGRSYQTQLITGDGTGNTFLGLLNLCDAGQKVATGANGGALSFAFMDELLDLVIDKDGQTDYMVMNARTIRSYKALVRALGGAMADDVYEMPSGNRVIAYSGVPIFRNDYLPINQVKGAGSNQTTILAGTLDDGSRTHGIAGLTARESAGIVIEDVGIHQSKDERITRVKWYCGLALFSLKGLAAADGITN